MKVVAKKASSTSRHLALGLIDWLLSVFGYALILLSVSLVFKKTVYIDPTYYGLWGFLASVIIFILNKTIKPVLVWITLPLTGLTLGIFYPFINVFILYLTSFLLDGHFSVHGVIMTFFVAILISVMNVIMQTFVLNPLSRKEHI